MQCAGSRNTLLLEQATHQHVRSGSMLRGGDFPDRPVPATTVGSRTWPRWSGTSAPARPERVSDWRDRPTRKRTRPAAPRRRGGRGGRHGVDPSSTAPSRSSLRSGCRSAHATRRSPGVAQEMRRGDTDRHGGCGPRAPPKVPGRPCGGVGGRRGRDRREDGPWRRHLESPYSSRASRSLWTTVDLSVGERRRQVIATATSEGYRP